MQRAGDAEPALQQNSKIGKSSSKIGGSMKNLLKRKPSSKKALKKDASNLKAAAGATAASVSAPQDTFDKRARSDLNLQQNEDLGPQMDAVRAKMAVKKMAASSTVSPAISDSKDPSTIENDVLEDDLPPYANPEFARLVQLEKDLAAAQVQAMARGRKERDSATDFSPPPADPELGRLMHSEKELAAAQVQAVVRGQQVRSSKKNAVQSSESTDFVDEMVGDLVGRVFKDVKSKLDDEVSALRGPVSRAKSPLFMMVHACEIGTYQPTL